MLFQGLWGAERWWELQLLSFPLRCISLLRPPIHSHWHRICWHIFCCLRIVNFSHSLLSHFSNKFFSYKKIDFLGLLTVFEKDRIASEASYIFILSGQKWTKNAQNGPFRRLFQKFAVKKVLPDRSVFIGQKLAEIA